MKLPFKRLRAVHLRLGRRGESLACRLLRQKRYDLLCRNYRHKSGEIDIVARDGATLVFIEVKTRYFTTAARPAEGLNPRQQLRIVNAGKRYLHQIGNPRTPYRFDLVEVRFGPFDPVEVRHWQNHFSESSLRYYRQSLRQGL